MKKGIKITSFIVLIVMTFLFLTSCSYLDELRQSTAIIKYEDDELYLEYNGKKYLKLPDTEFPIAFMNSSHGRALEEDIPILLVDIYGDYFSYDAYSDMISLNGCMYCSEEDYELCYDLFSGNVFDSYCLEEYDNKTSSSNYHFFTSDESAAVKKALEKAEISEITYEMLDDFQDYRCIYLTECNYEHKLISNDSIRFYFNHNDQTYGFLIYEFKSDKYFDHKFPKDTKESLESIFEKYYAIYKESEIVL